MNSEIKKLQEEIDSLQKKIRIKQKQVDKNRNTIKELYRIGDLLQSFIPERGSWRDVYKWRYN